jgi:hypothetical protein
MQTCVPSRLCVLVPWFRPCAVSAPAYVPCCSQACAYNRAMHLCSCAGCLQCALLLLSSRTCGMLGRRCFCVHATCPALPCTQQCMQARVSEHAAYCLLLLKQGVWQVSGLHACAEPAPRTPATSLSSDCGPHTYVVPLGGHCPSLRECPVSTSGP